MQPTSPCLSCPSPCAPPADLSASPQRPGRLLPRQPSRSLGTPARKGIMRPQSCRSQPDSTHVCCRCMSLIVTHHRRQADHMKVSKGRHEGLTLMWPFRFQNQPGPLDFRIKRHQSSIRCMAHPNMHLISYTAAPVQTDLTDRKWALWHLHCTQGDNKLFGWSPS